MPKQEPGSSDDPTAQKPASHGADDVQEKARGLSFPLADVIAAGIARVARVVSGPETASDVGIAGPRP